MGNMLRFHALLGSINAAMLGLGIGLKDKIYGLGLEYGGLGIGFEPET